MPLHELYENRVVLDEEFPIQLSQDRGVENIVLFASHWHEDLELHYIVSGEADMDVNHNFYRVRAGDLLIANGNELHSAVARRDDYHAQVIIFDITNLSRELAGQNHIFHHLVHGDSVVAELYGKIFAEWQQRLPAYRQSCRAMVLELLVYLCRNHVAQVLEERDGLKRKKDLDRLNTVLYYLSKHYTERITNAQLADMICLSEDRFGHLFRDGVGKPPLQYINELRLKKALSLLRAGGDTVTEVAEAVGFRDYNHFGRLFRKRYGVTPYEIKRGKTIPVPDENSGIV